MQHRRWIMGYARGGLSVWDAGQCRRGTASGSPSYRWRGRLSASGQADRGCRRAH